jgi:hypothetical protein
LEDKGGKEEGTGNMDTLEEARMERGPGCCLANKGSLLVTKREELKLLIRRGDGHSEVPRDIPVPGDRDEETCPKGQSEGTVPSLLPAPLRNGVALWDVEDCPHRLLVELESLLNDGSILGDVGS